MFYLCLFLFALTSCTRPTPVETKTVSKFVVKNPNRVPQSKTRGYFQIQLVEKINYDDSLTFEAKVTANQDFQGAIVNWIIPAHSQTISGEVKRVVNIEAGQTVTYLLEMDQQTLKDQDVIVFSISKEMDGENHGGTSSVLHRTEPLEEVRSKTDNEQKVLVRPKIME